MVYLVSSISSSISEVDKVDITEVTVAVVVARLIVVVARVTGSRGTGLHVTVACRT